MQCGPFLAYIALNLSVALFLSLNRPIAETRDGIRQVQGRDKNALWLDCLDQFVERVEEAKAKILDKDYNRIYKEVSSTKDKISAIELENKRM